MQRVVLFLAILSVAVSACANDAATDPLVTLTRAYEELRARQYESAILLFQKAIQQAPNKPNLRKDLAYAYLKIGETERARDQFAEVVRLDAADLQAALEYGFLCYETKQPVAARRTFARLRQASDERVKQAAAQAFENIDRPLREGIARWSQAVVLTPDNYSAQEELARLAEQHDELALSAKHYERAWRLKPANRALLLDLGRVWLQQPAMRERALLALLAASRGAEPRTAEQARELLPTRYPYASEFQQALELDPANTGLRRELAFLWLALNRKPEAEQELERVVQQDPQDMLASAQLGFMWLDRNRPEQAMPLLEKVMESGEEELADRVRTALKLPQKLKKRAEEPRSQLSQEALALAEKSYQAGYLKDASKYYRIAHEHNPSDFPTILRLGWTHNLLHDDAEAVRWFGLARSSPEAAIAKEADTAYRNLVVDQQRVRFSSWTLPLYSSRWGSLFTYGQAKAEFKLGTLPVRPYLSVRLMGDSKSLLNRRGTADAPPQFLSESAFIPAVGLASKVWRGLVGWGEAGSAISYVGRREGAGLMVPDYRAGLSYGKGLGQLLGSTEGGLFYETNQDLVFVSRFDNDTIVSSQHRTGFTLPPLGSVSLQLLAHANLTTDLKNQYWANTAEFGPGLRFRTAAMPKSVSFSVSLLRGVYLRNEGNPRGPNYWDLRVGAWYAITR